MSGRMYKGVPVPFWFNEASADAFRSMSMKPDDVVLSSLPKGGTTWTNKILHSLMHAYDDNGCKRPDAAGIGSSGQVYPDALPLTRADEVSGFVKTYFGDYTFEELCEQPGPRLLSTHLFGMDLLPTNLLGPEDGEGTGRLVVVLRNLKDAMSSLHFFNGEAKDGWLGNEHGPGSYNRFLSEDCPNAFGSAFDWIKENDKVVTYLQEQAAKYHKKERILLVYFEALKADLPAQLDRINNFLELPTLTDAKRAAVAEACGFNAMKNGSGSSSISKWMRKGSIGDWKNHLNKELWERVDSVYSHNLGEVPIAGPLRHFQLWEVPGMPLNRKEWTLDTDPRFFPVFERVRLHDGMVSPDNLVARTKMAKSEGAQFKRPPSEYGGTIPSKNYPAEAGRYHLFVSGLCPWASSTATARHLLGLEDVISMDVADGQSGAGWCFVEGTTIQPWKDRSGPFWLHEVYQADDSLVTTRITVPVLWDTKTDTIVSNDSWTIVKIFSEGFTGMGQPIAAAQTLLTSTKSGYPTLFPSGCEEKIECCHTELVDSLLNGVYKAGLGYFMNSNTEVAPVLHARDRVYKKLDELNHLLSRQRFLLGDKLTAPDVRLVMNLLRWDIAYRTTFLLSGGKGSILLGDGYTSLKAYIRDIYVVINPVVDFVAIRQYYRIQQAIERAARQGSKCQGYQKEEKETHEYSPLLNLRPLIASAKEPAGERP